MPSSTLDRSRTGAKPSDWVVVVPGQQPVEPSVRTEVTAPAPRVVRRAPRPTPLPAGSGRFVLAVGLVGAFVALLGLVTGRSPLLTLGLATPHFVAYQGASAEQVRYVLDDGWSQTAAVPGALLMDWREGGTAPAMRLNVGNPNAEPEVAKRSADGTRIEAIQYRAAWPGVDAEFNAQPGGWIGYFIVQPGVDPAVIELEYVGATEMKIDMAGRLHVRGANGAWIDGTPESWQDGPSGREPVESHYELRGDGRFGFVVGPYDPSRPLVVDPPSERTS